MAKTKKAPSYLLPHNPLAQDIIEELKRLKGDKPWLKFELEMLTARYPDNTIFKTALERCEAKVAANQPPATQPSPKAGKANKKEVK